MSMNTDMAQDILDLLFNNDDITNIGDAAGIQGSTADGDWDVSLHTADPGAAGSVANELTYTGYARVSAARTTGGWSRTALVMSNAAAVTFGECTAGAGEVVTHFGIHDNNGDMRFRGALTASLTIQVGGTPEFAIGVLTFTGITS